MYGFSKAQKAVADLVLQGLSNQEIADKLFVCDKTVKFHVTSILKLAGAPSRHMFIAKHYMMLIADKDKKIPVKIEPIPEPKIPDGVPELPR